MLPAPFQSALVLTGPTGSGKSGLALDLAPRLNAEIVSMDSMALYRRMDILTAKPTPAQRQEVPHHLIDVLEPWESASVAWWLAEAGRVVQGIEARGKRALFVGGTPLYLKALLSGLFEGPEGDPELRERLHQRDKADLHAELTRVDPDAARRIHVNDVRRVIRALEVYHLTGSPISVQQQQWARPAATGDAAQVLWLDLPREELYARIDQRVVEMFDAGLVEEVEALTQLERPLSREARQALGYKEILPYLQGDQSLEATIALVQTRSRQFAKRQLTWFRNLPGIFPATAQLTVEHWQRKMT